VSDRPNALPWYRKPDARYGPTNFLLDAATKFIGQPLYDAYKGISQAAGFEQDPNAPPGYVSHDALNRAANGIAAGQVMGSGFAKAPAGALRSSAAGSDLDMSQAARMQRARDMGFDTETILYHGTPEGLDAFDLNKAGNNTGSMASDVKAVFMSPDPVEANNYAFGYLGDPIDGGRVMPLYVRGKIKRLEYSEPVHLWKTVREEGIRKARMEGFDGIEWANVRDGDAHGQSPTTVTAVFDPTNIRSVNAAFDPAKSSSSNLMAADPFAGAMVPTYPQPQRKNQLPMTF